MKSESHAWDRSRRSQISGQIISGGFGDGNILTTTSVEVVMTRRIRLLGTFVLLVFVATSCGSAGPGDALVR